MLALAAGEFAGDSFPHTADVLFGLAVLEEVLVYVQAHVFLVLLLSEEPGLERKITGWLRFDSFLPSDQFA